MLVSPGVVRQFGELVSRAERRIIEGMEEERIPEETSVTDRFLNELEQAFEHHGRRQNIVFRAWTLKARGDEEKEYGADFCGVLNIRFHNFQQTKGILPQAKMEDRGIHVQSSVPTRVTLPTGNQDLNRQVGKMLLLTPDSFVIVYRIRGFVVVPASSVQGLKQRDTIYGKPVSLFFKEFLMCFIGDHNLKAGDRSSLEALRQRTNSRNAIMFEVTKSETVH